MWAHNMVVGIRRDWWLSHSMRWNWLRKLKFFKLSYPPLARQAIKSQNLINSNAFWKEELWSNFAYKQDMYKIWILSCMVYGRIQRKRKCTFKMNNRMVRTIVSLELKILKRKKKGQAMNWKNIHCWKNLLSVYT